MRRSRGYLPVVVALLFCPLFLQGQQVKADSLDRKETKEPEKPEKKILFFKIPQKRDSTQKANLIQKAKDLIKNIEIPAVRDILQPKQDMEQVDEASLDSSMRAVEAILLQLEESRDTQVIMDLHNKRGIIHQIFGNKNLARESYEEVLRDAEQKGDTRKMAEAHFNIGSTFLEEQRYRRAQSSFSTSMSLYQGLVNENGDQELKEKLTMVYVDLGKCAQELGNNPEAMFYYDEATRLSEELDDKSGQGYAFTNMGTLFQLENDLPKAIEYHQRAYSDFDKSGNNFGKIGELNKMGALYLEQGNPRKAESYFKEAQKTAQQINSKEQLKDTYLSLSKSAEKMGQQNEALRYFQLYQTLKDSLSEADKDRQMKLMESTYLAQRQELAIQRLEKERVQRKNTQNLTFGGMGLLLVLTFGFWQRMGFRRKKKEAEIEQQRVHQLEKLDHLKDQFLANTSHELRTPLNGIIGLAESLSDGIAGDLPREAVNDLNIIAVSGRRLSNLVNDILDFSKLKNDDLQLQLRPVDIYSAADVVLSLCRPLTTGKSLKLVNEVPRDLPVAEADENRLQQILHNLVGNAIKFTEEGFVRLSAREEDGMLAIRVQDSGIGIPPDQLESIFQPFAQGDGSIARQYGGAGLGLSVSRQLIQLHGGNITVDSTAGEGSSFTFTLPISKSGREDQAEVPVSTTILNQIYDNELITKTAAAAAVSQEGQAFTVRSGKMRILAVDDEPINLKVLNNQLQLSGYEVWQASNGQEALRQVFNGQKFDLVLLDIMMPKMSGYEVCQKIRSRYSPSELPVVLLTAKNQVSDLVKGFMAGANDYITKPFSRDELLSRIKIHLGLNHVHRATSKFVPSEFLRSIGRESITDVQLGDQAEKVVTVFFSDIRDYTSLAETMTPFDNFQFVKALNGRMGPVIRDNHGFVNQYLGDAIMAIFTEQADDALHAAVRMQKILQAYNVERNNKNRNPIKLGMGMHTGPLIMGIIGDENRMDAATVSDTVNTASRIESLTKHYSASILISDACLQQMSRAEDFHLRRLGPVQVKGKKDPVDIFECLDGDHPALLEKKLATLDIFRDALSNYYRKDFATAIAGLEELIVYNPVDEIAQQFLQRAQHYQLEGVAENWTGIEEMREK